MWRYTHRILAILTATLLLLIAAGPAADAPLAAQNLALPSKARAPESVASSSQTRGPHPIQLPLNPNEIALRSGTFDVQSATRAKLLGAQEGKSAGYYLVHFKDRPDRDSASRFVQAISQENILHYIPYSAYLCRLDGSRMNALQAIEEIDWIGPWEPKYKISPTVYEATDGNAAQSDEFVVTLFAGEDLSAHIAQIEALGGAVRFYTRDRLHVHIDAAQVPQIAALNGVYWIERWYPMTPANDNGTWIVQTNQPGNRKAFNNGLTGSGQVIGIADTGVDADHLMFWDSARGLPIHTYNAAQRKIPSYYNWYQTGILTGTAPNQYYDPGDGYYPGAADPMYNVYDWDINQGHGSHVAGTAVGEWVTGIVLPTRGVSTTAGYDFYEGNAYGAKFVFQDLGRSDSPRIYPPPDLNDPTPAGILHGVPYPGSVGLFPQAMADGAYIHLDPWNSTGGFGAYTSYSRDVDEMMWANPNFLAIFPVGDDGPGGRTVTPPATAKDCLSVGASGTTNDGYGDSAENVASFSSWGPVESWNRVKPDVCVPGQVIFSALNDDATPSAAPNDGLVGMQGTSMAAAGAAGVAAMVRQYYMTGFYTRVANSSGFQSTGAFTPSAAMMKATIINSAEPMKGSNTGGTIPGDGQGWGRVLLDNALYFAGETRSLLVDDYTAGLDGAGIARPFFKSYAVAVGPGQPLVVDMAYTDPPGTAGSAAQMVNYLYVEVDHPNGSTYWLSGRGNFSNGQTVNNTPFIYPDVVQKVRINNPDPGWYTIYVVAFQTDQVTPGWSVQPYALAVSGNLAQPRGYVQFDQEYYTTAGPLNVTLMDADLAGSGTVTVTLRSAATGDTETATLDEVANAPGIFRRTFSAAAGAANPGDGTLQVADPDTLTVTYTDVSPAGVRTDTARIDGVPPVTSNASANPSTIGCTSAVTITATVDDSTTGNSNIQAAEYFVDGAGANGTGTPMSAADGGFDSSTENVIAADVAGLAPGVHTVYVHGRDMGGNWGATDAATVTVKECPILSLTKTVDDDIPTPGQLITHTIVISISNSDAGDATNAVVSDTLPGGLTFAGPVTLVPPQPGAILAGSAGDLPTLASGLTITVGQRITLTFPVTVNVGLAGGTVLTNTASVTCTEVITPQTGSVAVTIDGLPPVTSNTSVAPGAIQCGSTVTITATVDDSTTGGSIIQAAEYFIDAVGANGTGTPMSAVDGAFDSPVENVIAASVAGLSTGSHTLYVHGRDVAGNWGASDTATVTVRPCLVYLPIIQKAFASAPDLVVERIVVTSNNIQVVIENRGNTPVVDEFWVDVYISPATPPTRVNQTWDMLGSQGLVWGVTASALSQLEPGGTLTLTVGDTYYVADYSTVMWPLPAGTPVYAQVDSAAESSTYGAVLENHEITGGTYNNITSTVSLATGSASLPAGNHGPSGGASPASFGNLPPRQ